LLTFEAGATEATSEDIRLDLPEPTLASFKEIAGPNWLRESGSGEMERPADLDGWELVFLPAGATTPYATQKSAEAWVVEGTGGVDAGYSFVEIALQGVRVLRAERRIVVIGSEDRSIRKGVAQFELMNDQLRRLETRIAGWWKPIEDDIKSLYANRAMRLPGPRADVVAEATLTRNWLIRAESVLDQPDLTSPPLARRVFLELSLRSEVAARLRMAERAVDSIVAFYEYALSQVAERQDARKSLTIEFGILIAILAEIGLQLWAMWR
jgi:hypothetical protein